MERTGLKVAEHPAIGASKSQVIAKFAYPASGNIPLDQTPLSEGRDRKTLNCVAE
tara:strand:+ start:382 stop:546 length:165 start_codon:yes stop_codon:yes gene_type:complete